MTKTRLSELKKLFAKVKKFTAARGKKTELATFLGILPQQLNNWLSEINEPGGEITLQMLEWVSAEEAKQNKKPETVRAVPGRKTRSTQITYEKRKSNPRKK